MSGSADASSVAIDRSYAFAAGFLPTLISITSKHYTMLDNCPSEHDARTALLYLQSIIRLSTATDAPLTAWLSHPQTIQSARPSTPHCC